MLTRPLLIRCVHTSGFWRLSKWSERIRLEMNNRNDTNGFCFIVAPRIMLSIFFKLQFDASPPKQQTGHILISRCEKSVYSNAFKLHMTSFQENANDIVRCNRFGFACVTIIDFFFAFVCSLRSLFMNSFFFTRSACYYMHFFGFSCFSELSE